MDCVFLIGNAMVRTRNIRARRDAFTLIELIVVVVVIAIISGLLLPVIIQAADRARRATAAQEAPQSLRRQIEADRIALPSGPLPILDSVNLMMTLASSYHRIGMDVFTRYRVDCAGQIAFLNPGNVGDGPVLLVIPFPDNNLEARDVQLKIHQAGSSDAVPPIDIVYNRRGIYCLCAANRTQPLIADVSFTALGREQFDYTLPPARQLRSVSIVLNLRGVETRTVPDDALQPSSASPNQLRWAFANLVSDRRITVEIPSAQAPLARMLLLSRLVAIAVLLFGAGFGYLSEQARPGQLEGFRLGHFLLLALTYSLFFIIFAVLEFHGGVGTPAAMALSATFSLPLLVLHVSRVLNLDFAITRVVPLAFFTLGLVINGVYGGAARDYVFIGAAILIIASITLNYQSWTAGRDRYRREKDAAYTQRRRALIESITIGLGRQMAELTATAERAADYASSERNEDLAGARARLKTAAEPAAALSKEFEELTKRLSHVSTQQEPGSLDLVRDIEQSAEAFRENLTLHLANLLAELDAYEATEMHAANLASEGEIHCAACGAAVPDAAFCQACGAPRPAVIMCAGCGERITIPAHLLSRDRPTAPLFCPRCGRKLPLPPLGIAAAEARPDLPAGTP